MKKSLFLLACFVLSHFASAQMKSWTWDTYKVKYSAPSNFKISKNTKEAFSAGNTNINLTIYPRTGENLGQGDMVAALRKWAHSSKVTFTGTPEELDDLNGYWGVYLDGTAENGNPTTLLLLVDPDYPEISLYIWLQYQDGYVDTAVAILKSFTPN